MTNPAQQLPEETRATELLQAQAKAVRLFEEIDARGLIRPGITEKTLNADIYALAKEMYGITTYWHKRIVRAGKNTLLPYAENPPDLMIETDDILFFDLGPVFEHWEADFGAHVCPRLRPAEAQNEARRRPGICPGQAVFQRNSRDHQQ